MLNDSCSILKIFSKNGWQPLTWQIVEYDDIRLVEYVSVEDAAPELYWDVRRLRSNSELRIMKTLEDADVRLFGDTVFHYSLWKGCSTGADYVPDGRYVDPAWAPRQEWQELSPPFWGACVDRVKASEKINDDYKAISTFVGFFCNGGCQVLLALYDKWMNLNYPNRTKIV